MIRLRQSHLEAFRKVCTTSWASEAELIRALSGNPDPPNEAMRIGTAFHAILADPIRHQQIRIEAGKPVPYFRCDGWEFGAPDVWQAVKHAGPGLCEVAGSRVFEVAGRKVELTGTADHVRGLVVQDHKVRFSPADPCDYDQSLQWRAYLTLLGGRCFRYNLFYFSEPKDGRCELKDITAFRLWPYPGMKSDVKFWLDQFVEWAGDRGLIPFLEERKAA